MPNVDQKFCPNVDSEINELDSSMAKNDENTDSGSPSLSEEENNVSDNMTSDRPQLVVDLNIPLQQDRSEPGEGVVNYGFEFGENRMNDCAANLNDSKSPAKDKYVNESTNHRHSATLLGKVLNTSCDTEITIPDDPNMNCNKLKTRSGNAKNKESHVPEKIPLEEVHSTVAPIISDNYEKALEAEKEYSAAQNGGRDISHDVSGVNTDKLNQQNNGKRFEEYFMPANTHKKFLRGEKLYLTKEKEVATCSGWKLAVVCGSLLLVVVGVLLGVLAGVGVLVKESSSLVTKGSSLPDSASMSAEAKHSNELPLSSLPITVNPNHPSLQTVPKVLIVELTLANESFGDELLNNSSKDYISLVLQMRKMLANSLKNLEVNFTSVEILNSRSNSIIARFIVHLEGFETSESNITEILEKYIKQKNNVVSSYHVKKVSVWISENFNTCLVNNGNCSHDCHWNQKNYSQTCLCPTNFILSDDSKTCLKKHLGNNKINGITTEKTTLTPKMTTEVPTTQSPLLLVTEVVTTMPKLGPSTWTDVSTTIYDSTLKNSATDSHIDAYNTEQSGTSSNGGPHEVDTYETTLSENQVLELTTEGSVDDTSDLAPLTTTLEETFGWNDNNIMVTRENRDWPPVSNLTDSVEDSSIYNFDNNTSTTLELVTDSYHSESTTNSTIEADFGNSTNGKTLLSVDNVTNFDDEPSTMYTNTENSMVETDTVESVVFDDIPNNTVSTVMFSSSFDHSTTENSEVEDLTTTRMRETTIITTEMTYSSKTFTNWGNASNVTSTTIPVSTDSSFTSSDDPYSQTILTPLLLNVTNSANLNNNTSPLFVVSSESTSTEQEAFSAHNVTKEQTLIELDISVKNSTQAILHTTENIEDAFISQITVIPSTSDEGNGDVTDNPIPTTTASNYLTAVTNEVMHLPEANISEGDTNETVNNDFLNTDFEHSAGKNISIVEVSTNLEIDIPDSTVFSEETIPTRTTKVHDTDFFSTVTNNFHPLTSTENNAVNHTGDEIVSDNDYSTSSVFIIDRQNMSDSFHTSNITMDSKSFYSPVTDPIALSEVFTTEHEALTVQTEEIVHKTEGVNISETKPPVNYSSEHPIKDEDLGDSNLTTGINETTSCDNCTDTTSIVEKITVLPTVSTDDSNYTFDADSSTSTSTEFDSGDFIVFPTNASVELIHSYSSPLMDFTTVTELTDGNTTSVEIDASSTKAVTDFNDSNTTNIDIDDSNTIINDLIANSTMYSTSTEVGYMPILGNVSSALYNESNEVELKSNASDLSISQLNETSIEMSSLDSPENGTEVIDINIYVPNENISLNDYNHTSNVSNQVDFEMITMDNVGSSTEYENQTDAVSMTSTSMESGQAAVNETLNSNCSEGTFPCSDGSTCLDIMQQCDGIIDCPDASDETQCEEDCGLNFLCTNTSLCVSASSRCDDIWDCEDGSDEAGCDPTSCGIKEVMCSDGSACIKPADICNEVYNCNDKSDEIGCVERTTCDTNRFFCPEGLCIPLAQLCDAVQDCSNGEDEANCSCAGNDVFQCSNSICLPKDVFCDGKIDCQDGSDERGCVQVDIYGVVQVYDPHNETWKLLCGESWSNEDGNLLCQELGFSSAREVSMVPVSTEVGWMERNNYTTNNSTLWTLGVRPVDFCFDGLAATVRCEEYACGGIQNQYRRKRIAEGQEIGHLPGQWTSLAVLYSTESNKTCHGEVISPVWILTSSQCLISHLPDFSDLNVRAGVINSNELVNSTQERKAQEVIIHPHSSIHRSPALRDYDVALIRIDEPFELNRYVNAICLGEEEIQEGITCFTGSFQNRKSNAEPHSSSSLSHLAVSVTDRNSCNSTAHYSKSITSRMICGQTTGSTSLCNNDDGVPLMCLSTQRKYHVAGMLSYQHNCGIYYKQPAVFSNINDMRPFIETIVGKYRYNVTYDSSLYVVVEMTENSTASDNVSTTEFDAITLQTELLGSTDTMFETGSTEEVTLAPVNSSITSSLGEDFITTTAVVMTQAYLSNETSFIQSTTTDVLENSTNGSLLSKLVSNTNDMQDYNVTPKTDELENVNNSSVGTTVTLGEFELLTEIHSTIPSIKVTNDTRDYVVTNNSKALDYESASVDRTVMIPVNSTEPGHSSKDIDSALPMTDYNVNISDVFRTLLTENATHFISDSVTVKSTTAISNIDLTESDIDNPVTETEVLEQQTASQPHKDSTHSANFPQSNVSLKINVSEQSLKDEYISNATISINKPVVTENSTSVTFPFSTGITDENMQSIYESTTMEIHNSKSDKYEYFAKVTDTAIASDYNDSNFYTTTKYFDTTISSVNSDISTNANISSQPQFASLFQVSTHSSVLTDSAITTVSSEIVKNESSFKTTQALLINSTVTDSKLIDDESSISMQDQEISVSWDNFDNSTHFPNIQEQEQSESIASESSVLENYSTYSSSECGIKDLETANTTQPYVGVLKGSSTCLASIISSKWVITSHNCLVSSTLDNTTWTFLKGQFHYAVRSIKTHPQSNSLGIDVAIVELEENIESSSSICLPKYNMISQHHCETVIRIENMEGESTVIYIPVSVEPVMNCDISYNQLSVQHICISNVNQICQENGIPLMCVNDNGQWQLQGISSIKMCGEDNSTSIFIEVASLVPWVESTILQAK